MSHLFSRLAARAQGDLATARPRRAARFEGAHGLAGTAEPVATRSAAVEPPGSAADGGDRSSGPAAPSSRDGAPVHPAVEPVSGDGPAAAEPGPDRPRARLAGLGTRRRRSASARPAGMPGVEPQTAGDRSAEARSAERPFARSRSDGLEGPERRSPGSRQRTPSHAAEDSRPAESRLEPRGKRGREVTAAVGALTGEPVRKDGPLPRSTIAPASDPSDRHALSPSGSPSGRRSGPDPSSAPVSPQVTVHIGRVEVRAVVPPKPRLAGVPAGRKPAAPSASLDRYVERRKGSR